MELSKDLARRLFEIGNLTQEDKEQIRNLLLDFFAAMFAGYRENKQFSDCVEKVVFAQGGTEEARYLFGEKRIPARSAAFMNSLFGHGAELDDGNKKAMGHVGVHVIPAVLALAEAEKKTTDEIMVAIAVGYEAYIRISASAQPGMVNRSFHSTGFAGAPACAAACAKLLGLDAKGIESAMSLACTMSSGLLTYSESQQMIKPINPAKAAETGVFAARLAQTGIIGPENCLEGPHGWYKAATDQPFENMITEDYGHLLMHECYFKLYPSCRHTHCGIEAATNVYKMNENKKAIKKVNVHIYPNAITLAGQIQHPQNADETKFSIHYTLACALFYGEYGVAYMNPPRQTAELHDLISKIELIPDETMEMRDRGIRGTRLEVILEDGEVLEDTVLVPKGDPEKPLTREDIISKLNSCARGVVSDERLSELISYLASFGEKQEYSSTILFEKGN